MAEKGKKGETPWNAADEFASMNKAMKGGFSFLEDGLSDTEVVLQSTSLIDQYLKFAMLLRFRADRITKTQVDSVFGSNGPLATFSQKINLCTALGMLQPDVKHDLKVLKTIRNSFAHSSSPLRLEDMTECMNLKLKPPTKNLLIKDDVPQRLKVKQSCAAIIPLVAISCAATLAESAILKKYHGELVETAQSMIRWIYAGNPIAIGPSE